MRSSRRISPADQDTRSASDIIHDGTAAVRSIGHNLSNLAHAFDRTGNAKVADELYEMASALLEHGQAIIEAYQNQRNIEAQQSIRNGERFIGGIITGILAGHDPKDAAIAAMPHHFDRDIIEASGA